MAEIQRLDREDWYAASRHFLDYSYRQHCDYGAVLAEMRGARCENLAFTQGGDRLGVANTRIKTMPGIGVGLAFLSFGPVCRLGDASDFDRLGTILDCLVEEYVRKQSLVLRIQPSFGDRDWIEGMDPVFRDRGFQPQKDARLYRTQQVPIRPSDEEQKEALSKRWRRHLNQSLRKEIEIRSNEDSNSLKSMIEFHEDFIQRKGFQTDLGADFYTQVQERLPESDRFLVSLAYVEGELAAGTVQSLLGDTMIYILGGRNEKGSATQASYLLHWKGIQIARERGLTWYDTGGIDPEENPGVATFKEGLGGEDLTASGPWEMRPDSLRGLLFGGMETLYRMKRNLKGA